MEFQNSFSWVLVVPSGTKYKSVMLIHEFVGSLLLKINCVMWKSQPSAKWREEVNKCLVRSCKYILSKRVQHSPPEFIFTTRNPELRKRAVGDAFFWILRDIVNFFEGLQ